MSFEVTTSPVSYGKFGEGYSSFQHVRKSALAHAEAARRMRAAVLAADLWILGEVDAQALVKQDGYLIGGAVQILAFHPRFLVRILEEDTSALLSAPIKFAILELDDGSVAITWTDQAVAFQRYGKRALLELGAELDALCMDIVDNASL